LELSKEKSFEVCLEIFLFAYMGKCFFFLPRIAIPDLLGFISLALLVVASKALIFKNENLKSDVKKIKEKQSRIESSLNTITGKVVSHDEGLSRLLNKENMKLMSRQKR